jgi:Na+-translocating ferredoxin:NAD+ oxidoreductase RnfC subunit
VEYDVPTPFERVELRPQRVTLPLSQHTGAPAEPRVSTGQQVARGDVIGEIPTGKLGARLHASIGGVVTEVGESIVIEGA